MKTNVRRAVHKIALIAFMHSVCGNAQPVPPTNHAEITITGVGAALTVKCTLLKSVSATNLEESPSLFVFLMRTNGPDLNKQLLETDFDTGGLKGMFQDSKHWESYKNPSRTVIYGEIRDKKSLKRVGYRLIRLPLDETPLREGMSLEVPVGGFMLPPTGILAGRDLDWFGGDVVVSAVLATWKKDSKTGGFSSELFSAVVSKKVNIQR
jgi:hypothetical protein